MQARLDARHDVILEAAVRLLAREGFAGCSVAAIAIEAGISAGSVYQSFSGESELAASLFRKLAARELEAVAAAAGRPGSAAERVAAAVEAFAARALQAPRRASPCSPNRPIGRSTPNGSSPGGPSANPPLA